jgi:broad specificity phosphatase PhoE
MAVLYTVRHAEPETTGLLLGRSDPGLSVAGRVQAAGICLDVKTIYSSPLRRAVETAKLCARGSRVMVIDRLTEITYGEWDGLAWTEIETKWPELARRKLEDWPGVTPPGGENWDAFTARVREALAEIRRGPLPAVIVAHSTVNSILDSELTGRDPFQFVQQCGEVLSYEI